MPWEHPHVVHHLCGAISRGSTADATAEKDGLASGFALEGAEEEVGAGVGLSGEDVES